MLANSRWMTQTSLHVSWSAPLSSVYMFAFPTITGPLKMRLWQIIPSLVQTAVVKRFSLGCLTSYFLFLLRDTSRRRVLSYLHEPFLHHLSFTFPCLQFNLCIQNTLCSYWAASQGVLCKVSQDVLKSSEKIWQTSFFVGLSWNVQVDLTMSSTVISNTNKTIICCASCLFFRLL